MRLAMLLLTCAMLAGNLIDKAIIDAMRDGSLWRGNIDEWFLTRFAVEVILGLLGFIVSIYRIRQACDARTRAMIRLAHRLQQTDTLPATEQSFAGAASD